MNILRFLSVSLVALAGAAGGESPHWAFAPVSDPPLPAEAVAAAATGLDGRVQVELAPRGWSLSAPLDRRRLLRRAAYDITGLPPDADRTRAFLAERRPESWEREVDRLLASPRLGERWARHWLDVARYADNKGYVFQEERTFPYAYTYRDWVTDAFNADLPYDDFVRAQLAGDRVAEGGDSSAWAGMGFLTLGRRFLNREPDIIDDRIDVTTRGLMGLTVSCARCHDHKYDPVPIEDYYSLYGVFASSTEPSELPLLGDPAATPGYEAFAAGLREREEAVESFLEEKHAAMRSVDGLRAYLTLAWEGRRWDEARLHGEAQSRKLYQAIAERWRDYLVGALRADHPDFGPWHRAAESGGRWSGNAVSAEWNPRVVAALGEAEPADMAGVIEVYARLLAAAWSDTVHEEEGRERLRQVLVAEGAPTAVSPRRLYRLLNTRDQEHVRGLRRKVERYRATADGAPARGMALVDRETPVEPVVFVRGDPGRRGQTVPRRFLSLLAGSEAPPFSEGSGRSELAEAICDPANPLTGRVIANRVWMHYFGEPLVENPSDFGVRTPRPEHFRLLDHLATDLVASGWSLKRLHRTIALSATYRQDSADRPELAAEDPTNRLLSRQNRKRLEWEALRDSILAVCGMLDGRMGGRPFQLEGEGDAPVGRRTLYAFIDRQNLPATLRTFDLASPDAHCPQRHETTVPQQALYLMNHPFVFTAAETLTRRAAFLAIEGHEERADWLYGRVLGRPASPMERVEAAAFVTDGPAAGAGERWVQLAHALLCCNEFVFLD